MSGGAAYLILRSSMRHGIFDIPEPKPLSKFEKLLAALSVAVAIAGPVICGAGLYHAHQTRSKAEEVAAVQSEIRYGLTLSDGIEEIKEAKFDIYGSGKCYRLDSSESLEHIEIAKQELSTLEAGEKYIAELSEVENKISEVTRTKLEDIEREDFALAGQDLDKIVSGLEQEVGEIAESSLEIHEFEKAKKFVQSRYFVLYTFGPFAAGLFGLFALYLKKTLD